MSSGGLASRQASRICTSHFSTSSTVTPIARAAAAMPEPLADSSAAASRIRRRYGLSGSLLPLSAVQSGRKASFSALRRAGSSRSDQRPSALPRSIVRPSNCSLLPISRKQARSARGEALVVERLVVAVGAGGFVALLRRGRLRVAEVGERHADRGERGLVGRRKLRGLQRREARGQRLVTSAQALVPGLELRAVPFVDVAGLQVRARRRARRGIPGTALRPPRADLARPRGPRPPLPGAGRLQTRRRTMRELLLRPIQRGNDTKSMSGSPMPVIMPRSICAAIIEKVMPLPP